ncbi:hypothetical protein FOZ63_009370 [Perkinsus olseni]|uniref:Uncharacterized protein n=1 Tax=Perkinsus olseni TaxID=32597 RepID=A0A7J6RUL3_PEROL|nr:hypothetical protein FOZ63_009370 [Perkinsus olseni]
MLMRPPCAIPDMSAISEADAASIASKTAESEETADAVVQAAEFAVNEGVNPAGGDTVPGTVRMGELGSSPISNYLRPELELIDAECDAAEVVRDAAIRATTSMRLP